MTRFLLTVAVLSLGIAPIALSADGPVTDGPASAVARSASTNLAPVYVKVIWPDGSTPTDTEDGGRIIESWVVDCIKKDGTTSLRALTTWMRLVEGPFESTTLWDGKLDGETPACQVVADVLERKDGKIKICFRGWTPFAAEVTMTLVDEPGSRTVVAVKQAETRHGMPHVAIFVGVPVMQMKRGRQECRALNP